LSVPGVPKAPAGRIVGTDRLGRPFTDEERDEAAALLRAHDFDGARKAALLFAYRRARSTPRAKDLVARASLRLLRSGWDPAEVSLKSRMLRLVWSEWTHAIEEDENQRLAEENFLRELGEPSTAEERTEARARLERLHERFAKAKDEVNLLWLHYTAQDIDEPKEMARLSGRKVEEFYLAADRRKRHVKALLAEDNGVTDEEET
jgi:hypothetical protein